MKKENSPFLFALAAGVGLQLLSVLFHIGEEVHEPSMLRENGDYLTSEDLAEVSGYAFGLFGLSGLALNWFRRSTR